MSVGIGVGLSFFGSLLTTNILPLDGLSVTAAFSLRKVRTAHTGAAIRVRRSSDNFEQDIGFTSTGGLDTTGLLAFVGAGSGFVTVWYGQVGQINATQATAENQPRIVNAGVVEQQNGRPSLWFDGVNDNLMVSSSTMLQNNPQVISSVVNLQGIGANSVVSNDSPGQYGRGFGNAGGSGNAQIMFNDGWSAGTVWPVNSLQIATASWSTLNVELYLQGMRNINRGSRETGNLAAGNYICIGSGQPSTLYSPAKYISEIIITSENWNNRPSSQVTLEKNQGAYFGVSIA
jgi:hypothetical protein